ncbi:type IV pilus biogenesis/stability protein PilW [Zestomonas thermotolerans]|uniref:type IV pilus biogenesis/stability protein PilW n=1 Tax=Zestomonas thermotolerans TaxID=157784 RepID=UPI0023F1B162|nr:type IV pilus biogenesis/stability protein PilW [Pseudomonas thermotolerans]
MTLRPALFLLFAALLAGCVSSGNVDPLKTEKGRTEARDAYIQLGLGYLRQGETGKAKVPLKKALELDPSSVDAHAALGLVFQVELEPQLADQHFRRALSIDPRDTRVRNNYGSFLFEQGRYPEALEQFRLASEDNLYSERSWVFENLGMTALKMNDREQARQYFERALRLNRRQPRSLLELALLAYERGEYVPARSYYERFSEVSEQNSRSLLLGIRLAKIFDDRDKAASLGLQLTRLYPGTPEYQQYLSEQ